MKKQIRYLLLALAGVLLLLGLLTAAEHGSGSGIDTYWDALWYGLVTLTTVGYGDLYPSTPAGKLIGAVIVLLSLGLLAALAGIILSLLSGRLLPKLKLHTMRRLPWYVFSDTSPAALTLAAKLPAHSAAIFTSGDSGLLNLANEIFLAEIGERLVLRHGAAPTFFLYLKQDEKANLADSQLTPPDHPAYVLSSMELPECPANITFLDAPGLTSRMYWAEHPLKQSEKAVLMIGSGKTADALLEQAMLSNVRLPGSGVSYYCFGEWQHFLSYHPYLGAVAALNRDGGQDDSFYFRGTDWSQDPDLLRAADRILLCSDDESVNLTALQNIHRYFVTCPEIHVYSTALVPGMTTFGSAQQLYTPELVFNDRMNFLAKQMHERYRAGAPYPVDPWDMLTPFMRRSNAAAADHLTSKLRILCGDDTVSLFDIAACKAAFSRYKALDEENRRPYREAEHRRWMRFHALNGWKYAEIRNNAARLHPLIVPFDELSIEEQRKDDYAWELLGSADELLH